MEEEVAPTAEENVPAPHWVQLEDPEIATYVPAAHEVQLEAPELE